MIEASNLPPELTERDQWLCWRFVERDGKRTKQPVNIHTGGAASSTDPSTWGSFEEAIRARDTRNLDGIGFVFTPDDPYSGLDLDNCRDPETREIEEWAAKIVRTFNSYTELSPSGTGLHIIVKGEVPKGGNKRGPVEMYSRGRFFTVTGEHLNGTPSTVEERADAIRKLHDHVFGDRAESTNGHHEGEPGNGLSVEEVLRHAMQAKNGDQFARLWSGDSNGHSSHSEADLDLCGRLAFWTGGDSEAVDRMFRQSGLMRQKWDRADYRNRTIERALSGLTEFYRPAKAVEPGPEPASWPDLDSAALYGLAGDVVKTIEPHTEADPVALLANLMAAFGNAAGRGAYVRVGADRHHLNLFAALVGETSKARKGMSWGHVRELSHAVDMPWADDRVLSGLSSGEGLIHAVRDPVMGQNKDGEPTILDAGETDKRLLLVEGEFGKTLKVMTREGNILSAVIRSGWDGEILKTLTKNSPLKATGAHISIIGHITRSELLRLLSDTDTENGFANRLLWIMVRRSKSLPFGGEWHAVNTTPLVKALSEALAFAREAGEVRWGDSARGLWTEVYPDLSEGGPGLFGAATNRAEAQTLRLAALYAVMDLSRTIERPHLEAALALWRYAEDSARCIFGDATGDPVAARIAEALRDAPDGLTRTDLMHLFGRNRSAERIGNALSELETLGKVRREKVETGTKGRPAERWFLK